VRAQLDNYATVGVTIINQTYHLLPNQGMVVCLWLALWL
jgi:hypothetical protein